MITAVFLPTLENPDVLMCDLQATALQALRAGEPAALWARQENGVCPHFIEVDHD